MPLNISRRKSVALLAAIMMVTSGAALGVGTFSYFSDTGQVNNNAFTAGTIDMKLSKDKSSWTEDLSGAWGADNFAPGDTMKDKVWIKNEGSLDGNALLMDFVNDSSYDKGFAQNIQVWVSFGKENSSGIYTAFNASMGTLYDCIHEEDTSETPNGDYVGQWDYVIFSGYEDKGTKGLTEDDLYTGYLLKTGTKYFVGLAFKFMENGNQNSLQGETTGFRLDLKTFHKNAPVTRGFCESVPMPEA